MTLFDFDSEASLFEKSRLKQVSIPLKLVPADFTHQNHHRNIKDLVAFFSYEQWIN